MSRYVLEMKHTLVLVPLFTSAHRSESGSMYCVSRTTHTPEDDAGWWSEVSTHCRKRLTANEALVSLRDFCRFREVRIRIEIEKGKSVRLLQSFFPLQDHTHLIPYQMVFIIRMRSAERLS
jgi:hypothetical protein